MFGVININKPLELTSHDVVARLRKCLNFKKIGHLGTLDPMASGVLPVCVGAATRLIEYFDSDKAYRAMIGFGRTTTTLDREGEIIEERSCEDLDAARILHVLPQFSGEITQVVPLYSAAHVNGKKLYEIARSKNTQLLETVELPTKQVTIHDIQLLSFQNKPPCPTAVIDVACSTGTYVRSLARDLGEALGCGGYLADLIRTRHGRFTLDTAIELNEMLQSDNPQQYLQDPLPYLNLPLVKLKSSEAIEKLAKGMKLSFREVDLQSALQTEGQTEEASLPALAVFGDQLIAVVQRERGYFQPLKVFVQQ